MLCVPCKDAVTTPTASITSNTSKVCVRCFTFWVLVILLALGIMAHYHDSNGGVHLG